MDAERQTPGISIIITIFGWTSIFIGSISTIFLWPEGRAASPLQYGIAVGFLAGGIFSGSLLIGFGRVIDLLDSIRWQLAARPRRRSTTEPSQLEPDRLESENSSSEAAVEEDLRLAAIRDGTYVRPADATVGGSFRYNGRTIERWSDRTYSVRGDSGIFADVWDAKTYVDKS